MKKNKNNTVNDSVLKEVLATLFFTIGLFSLISLLFLSSVVTLDIKGTMGNAGLYISQIMGSSFGICSFIFPLLMFYLSFITFRNELNSRVYGKLLSGLIFLISTTTLVGILFTNNSLLGYSPAGGWIGNTISQILTKYISGSVGTYILVTILSLLSLFILTGLTVAKLVKLTGSAINYILNEISDNFESIKEEMKTENYDSEIETSKQVISFENYRKTGTDDELVFGNDQPLIVLDQPRSHEIKNLGSSKYTESRSVKDFTLPPVDLLDPKIEENIEIDKDAIFEKATLIENKLKDFGISGKVTEVRPGPVITMFEYKPAPGIKINKIASLDNDLAMGLSAHSIRIIAPIPGKDVIGIEVPNSTREIVVLRELIENSSFKNNSSILTLALGKDISGKPFYMNLRTAPHLMVAGTTGSGKSVLLNAVLTSLLYKSNPVELKFIMIDPKMLELSIYEDIPHLLHPVVTEPRKAAAALKWAVAEMESRYKLLSEEGIRDIESYNKKLENVDPQEKEDRWLPYIVIVIDELADLMMVAPNEIKESITRLSQKARAAGIHLIVATQRPSVDVVAGILKANFPARISFLVSTKVDSRVILDTAGAERLLGKGDMLFLKPGTSSLVRLQGALISDKERELITDYLRQQAHPEYIEEITFIEDSDSDVSYDDEKDELYDTALRIIAETKQASISMLQRRLKIGYNRAARIVEIMEKEGVIGPQESAGKQREVYIDINQTQ